MYVSQHLSFMLFGKATEGINQGQNRTRENRPSGIVGNVIHLNTKITKKNKVIKTHKLKQHFPQLLFALTISI